LAFFQRRRRAIFVETQTKIPQPRRGGIIGCSGAVSVPSPVTNREIRQIHEIDLKFPFAYFA